jgi:hypothetical protein
MHRKLSRLATSYIAYPSHPTIPRKSVARPKAPGSIAIRLQELFGSVIRGFACEKGSVVPSMAFRLSIQQIGEYHHAFLMARERLTRPHMLPSIRYVFNSSVAFP